MSENWDYIHAYPHTHARVDLYNSTELQSDRLFSVTFIFVFSMNFQASVRGWGARVLASTLW